MKRKLDTRQTMSSVRQGRIPAVNAPEQKYVDEDSEEEEDD